MKTKADLVKGWLRKAESDLANSRLCLLSGQALDTACFHTQPGAEKCLKAYLIAHETDFPFHHNLEKLIGLCAQGDPTFLELKPLGETLTPYAVEMRYDDDFWPPVETVQEALETALAIKCFVAARLPIHMKPEGF